MKAALEQACHKLGVLSGPAPAQASHIIEISDDEDETTNNARVRGPIGVPDAALVEGADEGDLSVMRTTQGHMSVHVCLQAVSLTWFMTGPPYDDDGAGMHQYLLARHKTVTFKIESSGPNINSCWRFDLFGTHLNF